MYETLELFVSFCVAFLVCVCVCAHSHTHTHTHHYYSTVDVRIYDNVSGCVSCTRARKSLCLCVMLARGHARACRWHMYVKLL